MRFSAVAFVLVLVGGVPSAAASPGPPNNEGPDVPALTEPVATVAPFADERFTCTESARTVRIDVPDVDADRILLEVTITPDGDPWDRLIGVAIGGVEVLRGITPRTEMTLRRDITSYAALLPPGGTADVSLYVSTFVGDMLGSVSISFHDEPALRAPVDPVPAFAWRSLTGTGTSIEQEVTFGSTPPSAATVELTLTGHGGEEFWYLNSPRPRTFHVTVDGAEVATVVAMPYVYALLGFGNENANTACAGPGTSEFGDTVHPLMWWTGQRAADAAGVHMGTGEIPSYRARVLSPELLTGARTVEVTQDTGGARWVASLAFLLEP